ncbi:hypothetical protein SSCG_05234 [Streptomyces clavuligerus]|nr:hypothetical protein SSCG_05234 [Streptomyces clavuligerus]
MRQRDDHQVTGALLATGGETLQAMLDAGGFRGGLGGASGVAWPRGLP